LKKTKELLNKIMLKYFKAFGIVLLLMFLVSCKSSDNSPVEPETYSRGNIVSVDWFGKYNSSAIISTLAQNGITLEVGNDVEVYKIIYWTSDTKGNLVKASGTLFIPVDKDNLSVMSIQHGTETKRTNVGSQSLEYAYEGFIGAGLGYYTLVPDYLGLGESTLMHPYHCAKTSAETVIDFIRACRTEAGTLNIKLNGQVFLAGYSEGGYVTMAAHREIQQNYSDEITVTASAPMAGAFDLYETAQIVFNYDSYDEPSYLAYMIAAYNDVYGWNKINDFFNSPYAEKISSLYDGTKTTTEINEALTTDLTQLFQQSFIDSLKSGIEQTFSTALKTNSLLDWVPSAPMKLFHGDADKYVPYQNSVNARDYFVAHGATNVELVTISGGDHRTAAIPAVLGAVEWFESIRLNKVLALK
jgi:pimeloyl-ACP methyl ester carboxylesterase